MRCSDVQHQIASGDDLREPAVQQHLAQCDACTTLAADDAFIARALGTSAPSTDPAAMFAELEQQLKRKETGPLAWLRSRPTHWRYLATGLAASGAAATSLATLRADIGVYPILRLCVELLLLAAMALLSAWFWLRPLHRPAPKPLTKVLVTTIGLVLPAIFALLPATHAAYPASLAGTGPDLVPRAMACLIYGTVLAVPVALLTVGLGRRFRRSTVLLAIGTGTLAGVAALQLHCPITHTAHLLLGHATLPALGAIVGSVAMWRRAAKSVRGKGFRQ